MAMCDELEAAEKEVDALEKHFTAYLPKSILQKAIQGKLAPQNIHDEPASELLKRIQTEKKKLIKEGKIKKEKSLPTITEDEIPYDLPEGWVWTLLDDLSTINGGYVFKSSNYTNEGYRVIRISDFDQLGLKDSNIVRHTYSKELESFLLNKNNILLAMTGGTVGKSYLVDELKEPMLVNQRVATINLLKSLSEKYIYYVIQSNLIQDLIQNAKNSTNDNISMFDIRRFTIPLPPTCRATTYRC